MSEELREGRFDLGVSLPVEKAVSTDTDGDLIIEGIAADYSVDRQDEAFLPGAFDDAVKAFIDAGGPLLYQHQDGMVLGQVLEMNPTPSGLAMKAVVPKPAEGSPMLDIYNKIKRGMIRGLSVSGRAFRKMTPSGPRIAKIDLTETSVTPVPVGPRALFGVAQKAFPTDFDDEIEDPDAVRSYLDGQLSLLNDRIADLGEAVSLDPVE